MIKSFDELTRGLPGSYAGWITVADREWLCHFLQERYAGKEPTILEVGAFVGSTTNLMVLASGGRAIVVDNWSGGPHTGFPTLRDGFIHYTTETGFYPSRIEIVDGASHEIGRTWSRSADLIYIDADHSYEGCRGDLELYGPWATDVLMIDDWDQEPVRRATKDWLARHPEWVTLRDPDISIGRNPYHSELQEKLYVLEMKR